jgi:phosphoesterase RecJ-like protein
MVPREALDAAAGALDRANQVTLACHVNPDPDAMGSMLGLACYLAGRGVEVVAASPNGLDDLPRWVESLPGSEHLVGLAHLVERAETVICIDHHRTNPGFGTINLIDPEAAATAELVFRLVERMGGGFGPDVAACLYAGLVTDTGRFQFESTSPEVLRIAAELRERPFDHARLAQVLYADSSIPYLRLLGKVLERVTHVPEASLIWASVTRKDLDDADVEIQETDEVIDVIRTAREVDVAAVIKEQRAGGWKISLRSRGDTDVSAVAEAFGGGGHRLASGYTSKMSLDETVRALTEALVASNPVTTRS